MENRTAMSPGRQDWSSWPGYDEALLGFPNYWYPVMWSGDLSRNPVSLTLLGQRVVFIRDQGKAYALHDRCLHRGVPLSYGRREFPGTLSCAYHGWTYKLETGVLVAAITDGPDSPICGKVRVRTYPVEERIGLIWVYMGEGDAPPVEADIPEELVDNKLAAAGRITTRQGNWRLAAENGFDEGHAKYLHRTTPFTFFRLMPTWSRTRVVPTEDGKWITRVQDELQFEADFPGLGKWPPRQWWKFKRGGARTFLRLPGMLRVQYPEWAHYEWYVPVDSDHHRYLQMAVKFTSGLDALVFKARYWTYIRWLFHGLFNNQDLKMVKSMDAPPERLYRPDVSIIAWRKMCEQPRGTAQRLVEVHETEVQELERDYTSAG